MNGVTDCLEALEKIVCETSKNSTAETERILRDLYISLKSKKNRGFPVEVDKLYRKLELMVILKKTENTLEKLTDYK